MESVEPARCTGHNLDHRAAREPKQALFLQQTGHVIPLSAAAAAVSEFLVQQGAAVASAAPH